MAKKKGGGSKRTNTRKREMLFKEDGQVYGRATAMLGNGRLRAKCDDGVERLCKIRGSMRRREFVHVGDLVLVALRDFTGGGGGGGGDSGGQNTEFADAAADADADSKKKAPLEKADVIFRYQPPEVQILKKYGEAVNIMIDAEEKDEYFQFDEDSDAEVEIDAV
jgi:initiation factor 1A